MDQKEKTDIKSLNLKELTVFMEQLGEKAFRAKQIYQWLHGKQAASFEEMTNIPKALIEKLKENSHLTETGISSFRRFWRSVLPPVLC